MYLLLGSILPSTWDFQLRYYNALLIFLNINLITVKLVGKEAALQVLMPNSSYQFRDLSSYIW